MTTFFGFAIADSMFPAECKVSRVGLSLDEFAARLKSGVTSCCNASHGATVSALNTLLSGFNVDVDIPETPPRVSLQPGDSIIVMSVRGLPRLTDNRHYTDEEIENAQFVFGEWVVE